MNTTNIFWIDPNKFDRCQHRIVSIAMMDQLRGQNLPITYLTSFAREATPYPGFHYLRTSSFAPGLHRITFLWACLGFLLPQLRRGGRVVLIVFPQTLYVALLARVLGWIRGCRVEIHLDFRTVPVITSQGEFRAGIKHALEYVLFWGVPIFLSRFFVTSYSFITNRMRELVGERGKPFCIWTSGVREELIPATAPSISGASTLLGGTAQTFELLYLGSVSPKRGVEEIVRAIVENTAQLPDFVFRIVGGGVNLGIVRRIVEQAGAQRTVVLDGVVPPERVPDYLEKADAFISPLPDHPWWRVSSPIKVFEYLATGKPLILTDTAQHTEVVPMSTPGIVWLHDLSPSAIMSAIRDLRANYDSYLRNCESRLAIARENAWSRQAAKLGGLLRTQYL